MCLYERNSINRRYTVTKKNGGNVPPLIDKRQKYILIPCGECAECRKKISSGWRVRLIEELTTEKMYFVTLTFSEESLHLLSEKLETFRNENDIAKIAVKLFRERCRKHTKKSPKHWFITELGHQGTERIHLHGFLFGNWTKEMLAERWKYGKVDLDERISVRTINYVVKYVTKVDKQNPGFKARVLCSPGIGKQYIISEQVKRHAWHGKDTITTYLLKNGREVGLPTYYRNKIWSDEQKSLLFGYKLDKGEKWVLGNEISKLSEDEKYQIIKDARERNEKAGYGSDVRSREKTKFYMRMQKIRKTKCLMTKEEYNKLLQHYREIMKIKVLRTNSGV